MAGFLLLLSIAAWRGGLRAKLAAAGITLCGLGVWANALSLAETGSGGMLAGLALIFFMRASGN